MKNKYNMTEDTLSAGTDGVSSYAVKISGRTSPIPVPANIQAIPENPESGNGVCDHHRTVRSQSGIFSKIHSPNIDNIGCKFFNLCYNDF